MILLDKYYHQPSVNEFAQALTDTASHLNCDPQQLLLILYLESGLHPQARTSKGSGIGFIQLTDTDAKRLGTTVTRLSDMDGITQLKYVERFLMPFKWQLSTLTEIYFACYFQDGVGQSSSFYFRLPTKYATANRIFPLRNNNRIQKWQIEKSLCDYFFKLGWKGY